MSLVIRWIIAVLAVWLTVQLGQLIGVGLEWRGPLGAALFVLVLAIVNALIRPIVKLLTLPLSCLTFGLFAFVVNAFLFWVTARVTHGITVKGPLAALFGSVVLSVLSGIINGFVKQRSR